MRKLRWAFIIVMVPMAASCASFQTAGQIQSGRRAMLSNEAEAALAYFQQAAQNDPDYIFQSMGFRETIWTYVGRAQYGLGRWEEARRSFERALSIYKDDPMAQLYLGLTMARAGDQAQGLPQLRQGMKTLSEWIEYLNASRPFQAYWDPNGAIRSEIGKTLDLISSEKRESSDEMLANAEWVGREMEAEVDRVRGDERREFNRDRDRDFRRGLGVGVGIGF